MRPRPAGVLHLAVAFGVVVAALSLNVRTVNALDADATTAESAWCIEASDSGAPPNCTYRDFLTCAVAAIQVGGSCKAASSIPAEAVDASSHRAPDSWRRSTKSNIPHRMHESSLSGVEREKLFREFVEWNRRRSNQIDIASGVAH
jgi:hypothetical protein